MKAHPSESFIAITTAPKFKTHVSWHIGGRVHTTHRCEQGAEAADLNLCAPLSTTRFDHKYLLRCCESLADTATKESAR